MTTVCKHCNLADHCRLCVQEKLRAMDHRVEHLCDFDDCTHAPTQRRGPLQLCAQHATEHDKLEHAALEREPKHALQVVLEAGFDADHIRSYSGRGMCGQQCLAVTGSFQQIMAGIVYALLDEGPGLTSFQRLEVRDALEDVKMDSMGRDTIVYFPGAAYVGGR